MKHLWILAAAGFVLTGCCHYDQREARKAARKYVKAYGKLTKAFARG